MKKKIAAIMQEEDDIIQKHVTKQYFFGEFYLFIY
jgi:hypothetical protein